MKKIGIAIDKWKQKRFEEMLNKNNFKYEVVSGIARGTKTITLKVKEERVAELATLVKETNDAARRSKLN
jgi:nitrogen regulatory protein PII-like uncharacterized protein